MTVCRLLKGLAAHSGQSSQLVFQANHRMLNFFRRGIAPIEGNAPPLVIEIFGQILSTTTVNTHLERLADSHAEVNPYQ